MTTRLNSVVPILQIRDLNETIAFYKAHLDFEVVSTFPETDPQWCMMRSGGATLMFTMFGHLASPQFDGVVYFYPDNVTELWERLRVAVEVIEPLQVMNYGQREFSVRDPNGFTLSFGEHSNEPPAHDHDHGDHSHTH